MFHNFSIKYEYGLIIKIYLIIKKLLNLISCWVILFFFLINNILLILSYFSIQHIFIHYN